MKPIDPRGLRPAFSEATRPGMNKRFYAACAAMQGILSNPQTAKQVEAQYGKVDKDRGYELIVLTAYKVADELLRQEGIE